MTSIEIDKKPVEHLLPHQDQIWTDSDINRVFDLVMKLKHKIPGILPRLVDVVNDDLLESDQIKHVITDNILPKEVYFRLDPEFFGAYAYQPKYIARPPEYLMSCFINRICPIRQSWLYLLERHHLLDESLMTFNVYDKLGDPTGDKKDIFERYFQKHNQNFAVEHEKLKHRIPICQIRDSLEQTVIDCRVALVIETYFHQSNLIAFSEKIFRQLQLPRPFVLFGHCGAVAHLRDLGFDVFDDWIDHSYDDDTVTVSKQQKILLEIKKFQNLRYRNQDLQTFEQKAGHNRQLLQHLKDRWPKKFQDLLDKFKHDPSKDKYFGYVSSTSRT